MSRAVREVQKEDSMLQQKRLLADHFDTLSHADEEGKKRVKAAVALLGEVPRPIFTGTRVPRHSLRWVKLAESKLPLTEQASLRAGNGDDVDETALL